MKILNIENYEKDQLTVLVEGDHEFICDYFNGLLDELYFSDHPDLLTQCETYNAVSEFVEKKGADIVEELNRVFSIDIDFHLWFHNIYAFEINKLTRQFEDAIKSGLPNDEMAAIASEISDLSNELYNNLTE